LDRSEFDRDEIDELKVYAFDGVDKVRNDSDIPSELWGGNNNDELLGGSANDWIYGEAGRDEIWGRGGNNHLEGGAGNDEYEFAIQSTAEIDFIVEAPSLDIDRLDFASFDAPINVDLANIAEQVVNANHLTLQLSSGTGIENAYGGDFDDTIRGNSRDNELAGNVGNDNLFGRTGHDRLYGGEDDDRLVGDEGNDTLDGDVGNDTYFFGGMNLGTDTIVEAANLDTDTLDFSGMKHYGLTIDLTKYGSGYAVDSPYLKLLLVNNTAIENVYGTNYRDTIIGNGRDNRLYGRDGNDEITGGGGADYLSGGVGDDQFWTDALDQVYGNAGRDMFDEYRETDQLINPRRTRYLDWRVF
jgi:Ca2+-binding RTX toxin-like protein